MPRSCLALLLLLSATPLFAAQPNIVFILADDLGWSDTTIYGTTRYYETPHIQRLADRGMRLTQAYTASPVCSPTRASIMTALWPVRFGITQARGHHEEERFAATVVEEDAPVRNTLELITATRLPTDTFTLAEALQQEGYTTAHFGKWHLGHEPYSPLEHGFDIDIPHTPRGFGRTFLAPWTEPTLSSLPHEEGDHLEDRLAAEAAKFIREQAGSGQPFFLNFWAFSVHSPWSAKEAYTEYFRQKRDPMDPQSNPVYAAMVKSLDDAVGTLMQALDDVGLTDNTIVIFSSDNGGNTYGPPVAEPMTGAHISSTSNYPLAEGKGRLYEGGIRVPTIFAWPGKIYPGSSSDGIFNSVDYFPTILEMIGSKALADAEMDGVSQWPMLQGGESRREVQFFYYPHYSNNRPPAIAVRSGDWKMIQYFFGDIDQTHHYELYRLDWDIDESQDLSSRFPEERDRLIGLIEGFLEDTGAVLPKPNPRYQPIPKESLTWR